MCSTACAAIQPQALIDPANLVMVLGYRAALQARDHAALAALMDRNFDLRRQMFGDAALGALNLRMVLAARALGGALSDQG